MAISSYKCFLMGLYALSGSETGEWRKIVDIKDFPDLLDPPEQLETTTLSTPNRTYIPGIQSTTDKTFTCNYSAAEYAKLAAMKDILYGYAVWFGGAEDSTTHVVTPTGSDGKFAWCGYLTPSVSVAGVNEVVNMTVTITPAWKISDDGEVDWGPNEEAFIPNSDSGSLGALSLSSAAGTNVGQTAITSDYTLAANEKYVFKIGTSGAAPVINYGEEADSSWTEWDGSSAIAVGASENGKKATFAVLNASNQAIKAGSCTLVVKTA